MWQGIWRWQILRAQFQTFRQSRRRVMEDNRFHIFFDDDNQMIVCLLLQSGKDKRIFVWFFVVVLRLFRFRFDISSSNICSIVFKSLLTNKCLGDLSSNRPLFNNACTFIEVIFSKFFFLLQYVILGVKPA